MAYTDLELQPLGLCACPDCGTACTSAHGISTHRAKVHGIAGTSRVSTMPRAKPEGVKGPLSSPVTPSPPPPAAPTPLSAYTRASFLPAIPNTPEWPGTPSPAPGFVRGPNYISRSRSPTGLIGSLKRAARTPSPGAERPTRRVRRRGGPRLPERDAPSRPTSLPFSASCSPSVSPFPSISPSISPSVSPSVFRSPIASRVLSPTPPPAPAPVDPPIPPTPIPSLLSYVPDSLPPPPLASTAKSALEARHDAAVAPALEKQSIRTLIAFSKVQVPEKRLHARQATLFLEAANRAADAFLRRPKEKELLRLLLLPRVLGLGISEGKLAATLRAFPASLPPVPPPREARDAPSARDTFRKEQDTPQRVCRLLEKGFLGRASRALVDPSPLAQETPEALEELRKKHPIGPRDPFLGRSPRPGQVITTESVLGAIRSIGPEKAPGLSGWTRPLIDRVTEGTADAPAPFLRALRLLADMIRQGTAPGVDLLCASRLIGLEKEGGGIRPIAVGDLLYRVAFKAILRTSFRPEMLLPNQLGVSSAGGVEPAVFLLEEAITGPNKAGFKQIASYDLSNAFNSIGRTAIAAATAKYAPSFYKAAAWAYNRPSLLVTDGGACLASAEGVRQGDPLAPLLFSLAFRPTLEKLERELPDSTLVAYLDDVYALSRSSQADLLSIADRAFLGSPLSLNKEKSRSRPILDLKENGLEALGTFIGPLEGRREFLISRIDSLSTSFHLLASLPRQHALLLLRGSTQLLLRHLLRQLEPIGLEDLWQDVDERIRATVLGLASRGGSRLIPSPSALSGCPVRKALIELPDREGGLGMPSHADLAAGLYTAARAASRPLLEQVAPAIFAAEDPPSPTAREVLDALNKANAARLEGLPTGALKGKLESASFLGRQWIRALPTLKNQVFADPEATEALRARLLLPCQPIDRACRRCGSFPSLRHEDTCRAAERRWISRHDLVTRAFTSTLSSRADLKVIEEPKVPNGEGAPLCPDFSVMLGTSRYYYDVQVVALTKDSAKEGAYETLSEAAAAKKRKYKDLAPFFVPLIFSAGGLMEKETAKAYKSLQKLIGPTAASFLDRRVGITLAKSRAISAVSILGS